MSTVEAVGLSELSNTIDFEGNKGFRIITNRNAVLQEQETIRNFGRGGNSVGLAQAMNSAREIYHEVYSRRNGELIFKFRAVTV